MVVPAGLEPLADLLCGRFVRAGHRDGSAQPPVLVRRSGYTSSGPRLPLHAGTRLGPYEILSPIGAGGMGEVYRARDTRLHRQVAIKILPSGSGVDPHFRERFDREARAVAALSHPNIVAIYDVGTHDGAPYAAIELLEGDTLGTRIGTSPLPLRTALDYAVQIARGLAAAHGRGIVHRDLKPGNIFVTPDNQVKILDFGLATQAVADQSDESTRLAQTERGTVLGTVGYMSPEQARGERADERSDIFSFGCVLYEMVSARRAFTGDSRIETLHAILKENPPDLAASGRDIPPALDRLIMHCLEKAPESRFQNARDLVFALENLTDVSARPTGATPARHGPRDAARSQPSSPPSSSPAAAALWWMASRDTPPSEPKPAAATAADPRWVLAVLPFENVTRDGGPGYFAAGMTDEVTSRAVETERPSHRRTGGRRGVQERPIRSAGDGEGARDRQPRDRYRPRGRFTRARQRRADGRTFRAGDLVRAVRPRGRRCLQPRRATSRCGSPRRCRRP